MGREDEEGSPATKAFPACCQRAIPAGRWKRMGGSGWDGMGTPGLRRALSGAGEDC